MRALGPNNARSREMSELVPEVWASEEDKVKLSHMFICLAILVVAVGLIVSGVEAGALVFLAGCGLMMVVMMLMMSRTGGGSGD